MSEPRTVEEIRAQFEVLKNQDPLGMTHGDLVVYLPEAWTNGTISDEYKKDHQLEAPPTPEAALAMAREYLGFAFEKAINHRGLSANRSVNHLINWAFLARRDDLYEFAVNEDNYRCYGVPILKHFAGELGFPIPPEAEAWQDGEPCQPGCQSGCNL